MTYYIVEYTSNDGATTSTCRGYMYKTVEECKKELKGRGFTLLQGHENLYDDNRSGEFIRTKATILTEEVIDMARVTKCDVCEYVGEHKEFMNVLLDATKAVQSEGNLKHLCIPCYESLLRNFVGGKDEEIQEV